MTPKQQHKILTTNSSYVANAVKHVWLAQVLQRLWQQDPHAKLHIFAAEVDDAGFDILLTLGKRVRHIQLKASHLRAKRRSVPLNKALANAVGGCVVWIFYEPATLKIDHFLFFGGRPGRPLPSLTGLETRKRTTRNGSGDRPKRPNIRSLPRNRCVRVDTIEGLLKRLFGRR